MTKEKASETTTPQYPAGLADEEQARRRSTRWLSRGFEELVFELSSKYRSETEADFDAVIIGSGYGGAVAARALAASGSGKKICVLERGCEYLPGAFPSRMADFASHVRFTGAGRARPRGYREGLFDVRVGKDVSAIVANGIGGGSLINAGVMLLPLADVFQDASWPSALRTPLEYKELENRSAALTALLGATNSIAVGSAEPKPHKFQALEALGAGQTHSVPITVALADKPQMSAGTAMDPCIRCGDCATGCNHNAKISLDVSLLAEARRNGAEIFSGATLLRIEKVPRKNLPPLWKLCLVHTDEALRRRQGASFELRAAHVVLAAGTFGSTEILLRSSSEQLKFSPRLGHHFSSNGDTIAAIYGTGMTVDGVGDETRSPEDVPAADRVGPTITGFIDLREHDGMVIQDLAVPGPLRLLMEEAVTTTAALHMLAEPDHSRHASCEGNAKDPAVISQERVRNTLVVAMMSRDSADGVLKLARSPFPDEDEGDGAISVVWPALRTQPAFAQQHRKLDELVAVSSLKTGRMLPSPFWKPLPEKLDYLLGGEAGPVLTVHPLGGCPMGESPASGVVDEFGRVFDHACADWETQTHYGLAVLDGSIVPTSLGINPALTIATLADRAIERLKQEWKFDGPPGSAASPLPPRPRFGAPKVDPQPRPTKVEIIERLAGAVPMLGMPRDVHVELTMQFDPIELRQLMMPGAAMKLDASRGQIRIFAKAPSIDDEASDDDALLVATLSGSMRALHLESSTPMQRRLRGGWAWFLNRGLRDTVLWLIDSWTGPTTPPKDAAGFLAQAGHRLQNGWDLSSRVGAVRRLDYEWTIEEVLKPSSIDVIRRWTGQRFSGSKRLTYSRRSNPWHQLSQVTLKDFPDMAKWAARPVLTLDVGYLARQGVPLFRIVDQQDQPSAMADLASFGLYLLRILLDVHVLSFRLPDAPRPRDVARLPGRVIGLPEPTIKQIEVATLAGGKPVMVQLTHYPFGSEQRTQALKTKPAAQAATEAPVLLIHGFSASGTTYAHHALRPSLAQTLWDAGRDVWIIDMRSSAGMPYAQYPWTFEEVAYADIPVAISHILETIKAQQLDVFAHCIGSAMLGMTLLGQQQEHERFWTLRTDLPTKIRSLVISQIPPAMVLTTANVFRAYAMRYLKQYLPIDGWQFRRSTKPGVGEQLLDRLLATLPYPQEEYDRENPLWTPWRRTPWVGTRHRMDALYGRDFSVNKISQRVLDYIDDQFGPLNLSTISQVIHFANFRSIANSRGVNEFLSPDRLRERYDFPVLILHGEDNGVASLQTVEHFEEIWRDAGMRHALEVATFPGAGHQDCLIGDDAPRVFAEAMRFYEGVQPLATDADPKAAAAAKITDPVYTCQVPAFGLRVGPFTSASELFISVGDHCGRGTPACGVLLPVVLEHRRLRLFDATDQSAVEPTAENVEKLARAAMFETLGPLRDQSRFQFSLALDQLPAGTECVLVMLLYRNSVKVGNSVWLDHKFRLPNLDSLRTTFSSLPMADPDTPVLGFLPDAALKSFGLFRIDPPEAAAIREGFIQARPSTLALGVLRLPPLPGTTTRNASSVCRFVLASCQYPGGMLDRTAPGVSLDAAVGPADASWQRLEARLDRSEDAPPSFMVLTGDQVYVDATAGLFDPKTLDERFDGAYENFLGARGPRSVLSRLRCYMLLDDHEIDDNWEPDPVGAYPRRDPAKDRRRGPTNAELKQRGIDAYLRYQRDSAITAPRADRLWDASPIDGIPFFLADSRSERSPRTAATIRHADLLRPAQAVALARWLNESPGCGPRFLVTGSMVLPRTLVVKSGGEAAALRSDAWDGYPLSLHRLLAQIYERGENDVVLLSGDAHRGNVTKIELTREGSAKTVVAHSIHCPALYAPYPFANVVQEDFARIDSFDFNWVDALCGPMSYHCSIESDFPAAGDGFAVIAVEKRSGGWRVDIGFDIDPRNKTLGETSFHFDIP